MSFSRFVPWFTIRPHHLNNNSLLFLNKSILLEKHLSVYLFKVNTICPQDWAMSQTASKDFILFFFNSWAIFHEITVFPVKETHFSDLNSVLQTELLRKPPPRILWIKPGWFITSTCMGMIVKACLNKTICSCNCQTKQ